MMTGHCQRQTNSPCLLLRMQAARSPAWICVADQGVQEGQPNLYALPG